MCLAVLPPFVSYFSWTVSLAHPSISPKLSTFSWCLFDILYHLLNCPPQPRALLLSLQWGKGVAPQHTSIIREFDLWMFFLYNLMLSVLVNMKNAGHNHYRMWLLSDHLTLAYPISIWNCLDLYQIFSWSRKVSNRIKVLNIIKKVI